MLLLRTAGTAIALAALAVAATADSGVVVAKSAEVKGKWQVSVGTVVSCPGAPT